MKTYKFWTLCFIANILCLYKLLAQPENVNTYAVVIGISKYNSPGIPPLKFAASDAKLFADFIKTGGAGKTRPEHIKTFYNEEASIAALYQALEWLKAKAQKNDRVFIYFAGHGDLESTKENGQGYLLAYNSPRFNYRNNAVSIEYLNALANDISIKKNAQVFIITDACHSGMLAGDFLEGKKLSSYNLLKILNNEVRLAACAPHQLAAEGKEWGNGRGVFSYHFLNSLGQNKKAATFRLVSQYLDSAFKSDKILKARKHEQQPQMDGNPETILAWPAGAAKMNTINKNTLSPMLSAGKLSPMGVQAIDYVINKILEHLNFTSIDKSLDFTTNFALNSIDSLLSLQRSIKHKHLNSPDATQIFPPEAIADTFILNNLKKTIKSNPEQNNIFIEQYILKVHHEVQEMINAYLEGDLAELEKRQYYYSGKRNYTFIFNHITQAIQFISTNHPLYQILNVNATYLKAVTDRLQLSIESGNTDSLLNSAQAAIEKAIKLDPFAPYLQNEAGNIYLLKKENLLADSFFTLATEYAPTWAIPWSNKSRLQLAQGNLKQATKAIQTADSLHPDLSFILINSGLIEEQKGNNLLAAELYHRAIEKNEVHFLPHERLGFLYNEAMEYDLANTYFHNAFERKKLFNVSSTYYKFGIELGGVGDPNYANEPFVPCLKTNTPIKALKALTLLQRAISNYKQSENTINKSIQDLKTAIELAPETPFAQHYLGRYLYESGEYNKAIPYLNVAIKQFNNNVPLFLKMVKPLSFDSTCINHFIQQASYPQNADFYLLATCYTKINKKAEAIDFYKSIIAKENKETLHHAQLDKSKLSANLFTEDHFRYELFEYFSRPLTGWGWLYLAKLYERHKQYNLAEEILVQQNDFYTELAYLRDSLRSTDYITQNALPDELKELPNYFSVLRTKETEGALIAFYERMMTRNPRNPYWFQQAGLFLYNRITPLFNYYNPEEYPGIFDFLQTFAYPFYPGDKGKDNETVRITINGTNLYEEIELPGYNPAIKGIDYLNKAIQLYKGSTIDDNLIIALAQLYHWSGYPADAMEWFNKISENSTVWQDKQVRLALLLKEKMFWKSLEQILGKIPADRYDKKALQQQQIQFCMLENKTEEVLKILASVKPESYLDSLIYYCAFAKAQLKTGNISGLAPTLTNLIKTGQTEKANEENYFEKTQFFEQKEWELMLLLAKTHLQSNQPDSAVLIIDRMKEVYGAPIFIFQYDTSWQFLKSDLLFKKWLEDNLDNYIDKDEAYPIYRYPINQLIPLPRRLDSTKMYR